jgi:hypothetical protein
MVEIKWEIWNILWNGIFSAISYHSHHCNCRQDLHAFMTFQPVELE